MWRNISMMAVFQLVVCFVLLFAGRDILDIPCLMTAEAWSLLKTTVRPTSNLLLLLRGGY